MISGPWGNLFIEAAHIPDKNSFEGRMEHLGLWQINALSGIMATWAGEPVDNAGFKIADNWQSAFEPLYSWERQSQHEIHKQHEQDLLKHWDFQPDF